MATYSYQLLPVFSVIPFDANRDTLDFGAGISAAQVFAGQDDHHGEISLFTDQRLILLLLDEHDGQRFSESNFTFADGSKVLVGDNSFGWRDDELAQLINGTAEGDFITGLGGADTINAGAGNDVIYLFAGEDDVIGSDRIDGGAGIDTLYLPHDVLGDQGFVPVINLGLTSNNVNLGEDGLLTVINVENVIGSTNADNITGSAVANYIDGGDDNDTLTGGGGDDTLLGGENNDSLSGGDGNDLLRGQAGRDTLLGGLGNDTIQGTGLAFDSIDGGAGIDTARVPISFSIGSLASIENIELSGGAGMDFTRAGFLEFLNQEAFVLTNDNLSFAQEVVLEGNSLPNLLTGNTATNFFSGGLGNDTFSGGDGVDAAVYEENPTAINANLATGLVTVGVGHVDTLISIEGIGGTALNDTLTGSDTGEDFLSGDMGHDSITAGDGNDILHGSTGNDVLNGGAGIRDLTQYMESDAAVFVNLSASQVIFGSNTVQGGQAIDGEDVDANGSNGFQNGTDTLTGIEDAAGWTFDDTLVGSSGANQLFGSAGNDTLIGGLGNDTLNGGAGTNDEARYDDVATAINANLGTGTVTRGAETDTLVRIEAIIGGSGNDSIVGSDANVTLVGSPLLDPSERFEGGTGNDTINGGGATNGFFDIVSYRNDFGSDGVAAGVAVNLSSSALDLTGISGGLFDAVTIAGGTARDGEGDTDTLSQIDAVWGSGRSDYLQGGSTSANLAGDPFEAFQGFAGNDTIDGVDGTDRADYTFAPLGISATSSQPGVWLVSDGYGNVDSLFNIDGILGSSSADLMSGWDGDEFFEGGGGNDTIDGHSFIGTNTTEYRFSPSGVIVNLSATGVTGDFANDGFGGTDDLRNINAAVGSDFNDLFVGQATQNNSFDGGIGTRIDPSSTMNGGIGVHQDQVSYFGQANPVNVNLGTESATKGAGGAFTDTLINIEAVTGTAGNDTITGSDTSLEYTGRFTDRTERFVGGSGNDIIDGGSASDGDFDVVQYLNFATIVNLGPSSQTFFNAGSFGNSSIAGGKANEVSFGTTDTLSNIDSVSLINNSADLVFGGSDSRSISGSLFEVFSPGGGSDTVVGVGGFDMLSYQGMTGTAMRVNLNDSGQGNPFGTNFFGFEERGTATFFIDGTTTPTGEVDLLIGIDGVRGGQGNDTLIGSEGDFELGNRQIFEGNKGDDVIDGWDAEGITSYRSSPTGVFVDIGRGFALDGWGTTDFLNSIAGVRGSDFDDTLIGGGARNIGEENWAEFFEGGAGNDFIDGADADNPAVQVFGQADHDMDFVEYRNAPGGVLVNLGTGTAQDGYGTTDTFVGIEGAVGSSFDDTLLGSAAAFEVFQGRGGDDSIVGGGGLDMLDFDFEPAGVVVNLGATGIDIGDGVTVAGGTVLDSWGGVDTVSGIEWVLGTPHDDILVGNDADNFIEALEGDDSIRGGAGNDTLIGGEDGDVDFVDYGSSAAGVTVDLGRGTADDGLGGTDTLVNVFHASGSAFADRFIGNDHDDNRFAGGEGNDTLEGGKGDDWALYEDSDAGVNVNLGTGTASDGLGGTDTLISIERVVGSGFADTLTGGAGNDTFVGAEGNDTIDGGAGFNGVSYAESPNAVIINLTTSVQSGLQPGTAFDGYDSDTATGGVQSFVDTLANLESVRGSEFADIIYGPDVAANSRVFIAGGGGNDTVNGGAGAGQTVLSFAPRNPDDFDFSDEASVFINLDDPTVNLFTSSGLTTVTFSGIDGVVGSRMNDSMTGTGVDEYFRGGQGSDSINGDAGTDTASFRDAINPVIANLAGSQTFTYFDADGQSQGIVTVNGGQALDGTTDGGEGQLFFDTLSNIENLEGGDFNDTLVGNGLNNVLDGGDGDDEFRPVQGSDTMLGGAGNDRVSYFNQSSTGVVVDLDQGLALKSGALTIAGQAFTRVFDATKPIVGSWEFDVADLFGHIGVVTFAADGTFVFVHVGSPVEGIDGIERGTYTFNAATGAFSATVITDTLLSEGFSHFGFNQFAVEGDTLILTGGGEFALTRVVDPSNPIVGGWYATNAGAAQSTVALTFFSDGSYVLGEDGSSALDPTGNDGLEKGTFTFADGTLNVTNTIDTNGEWGLTTIEGGNASYSGTSVSGSDQLASIEQVIGTALSDRLTGSDTIAYTGRATDGFEFFLGNAGNDTIDGGGATNGQFDLVSYNGAAAAVNVNLGTGAVTGGAGTDTISNIDMAIGGSFADTLTGGSQSRSFAGQLFESFRGQQGNDVIDGLGGEDRVDYRFATAPVVVTLGNGTLAGGASDGQGGTDTLRNVEQVRGSGFSDTLNGGGTHNAGTVYDYEVFEGLEGNDLIDGKSGTDIASYSQSPDGVIVNLGATPIQHNGITVAAGRGFDGFGTMDTLLNVEQVAGSDFADYFQGGNGTLELFRGGAGNDLMHGGGGTDRLHYVTSPNGVLVDFVGGTAQDGFGDVDVFTGMEEVRGSTGNDTFLGSGGDEAFSGLAGDDSIVGGAGNDAVDYSRDEQFGGLSGITVDFGTNTVTDGFGDTDTLVSIERVTATRFADTLIGSTGNDDFDGGAGNDSVIGGTGTDRMVYTSAQAGVVVNFIAQTATDGIDVNPALAGVQASTDTFSGVEGAVGGAFNDSFTLATGTELVDGAGGIDTVATSATYSLQTSGTNIENLTLTGSANIDGTGNGLGNVLTGNSGNNSLDGGGGADTMLGGAGNDIYVLNNVGDVVNETMAGSGGNDKVILTAEFGAVAVGEIIYNLGAGIEDLTVNSTAPVIAIANTLSNFMFGGLGNQTMRGGAGSDTLDGGVGNDSLEGGLGNDLYRVDSLGDIVKEIATDSGIDTVEAAVNNFRLPQTITGQAFIENLTLKEAPEILIGRGNVLNNRILGNSFNNQLFGDLGNDTLDGGAGDDRLFGGAGSDSYFIDGLDQVIEVGGSAADKALAAISLDLTNNTGIENAQATDDAGAISITGNKIGNTIIGNADSNVLNGGLGIDTLDGGGGNDTYVLGVDIDKINDTGGAGSIDLIQAAFTLSLVPFATIENLTLTGSGNINGTGNVLGNVITGNSGGNLLDGGAGSDTLVGAGGNDIYIVDVAGDRVDEGGSEAGVDEVRSTVTINLGVSNQVVVSNTVIENITLTGTAAVNATGNDFDNVIAGNSGNNSLAGGAGNDRVSYAAATAAVTVNLVLGTATGAGADALSGFEAATGSKFNDTLNSQGGGAETLNGGLGNDRYIVDSTDVVVEVAGQGTDTLVANFSATLDSTLENLELSGGADLNGTGNEANNLLTGNGGANHLMGLGGNDTLVGLGGNDTLEGGLGNDNMQGGAGDDTYYVNVASDVVTELAGAGTDTVRSEITYVLGPTLENLVLLGSANLNGTGNALANSLTGNDGDNLLNGMAGADAMAGAGGNDSYIVDNVGDTILEAFEGGTDHVASSVNFTLPAEVENLTLTGTAAIAGTGNSLNNIVLGNTGNNTLTGAGGLDTLNGGLGADSMAGGDNADVYVVDNLGDRVDETSLDGSTDEVQSTIPVSIATGGGVMSSPASAALIENITLLGAAAIDATGNASANVLTGNSAANILDGGLGNDVLVGGAGNDRYVLDNPDDLVLETMTGATGGIDTIRADFSFSLETDGANVENLAITSFAGNGTVTGNNLANRLQGNVLDNVIDGLGGADTMMGGNGNDTYHVDNVGDVVIDGQFAELVPGSGGPVAPGGTADLVISSVNFTLGGTDAFAIENLTLIDGAFNATGNAVANILTGNNADNVLNGMGGADQMAGGLGNDSYFVDVGGDVVTEAGDAGTDLITSAIDFDLSANGANVENLTLGGVATQAIGNDLDNVLTGNALANTLSGGLGNDVLDGAGGADQMTGGDGNDVYFVDNIGDRVFEASPVEGTLDEVRSLLAIDLTVPGVIEAGSLNNIEKVTLLGAANLSLAGNTGNNWLVGNAGANSITGGAGHDTLDGGAGADTMVGGAGDNVFIVDSAGDRIDVSLGGLVQVQSFVSLNTAENGIVIGGAPLNSTIDDITLLGSDDINAVGNLADNVILGNDGDNLIDGLYGNDTLNGGVGFDIADYSRYLNAVTVSLASNTASAAEDGVAAEADTLVSIEGIHGGAGNDTLTGDNGNNRIRGGEGNDSMAGGVGNDTLDYSTSLGAVTANMQTGTANDGAGGIDAISEFEAIAGGAGNDSLTGTLIANTLDGGAGADTLVGGDGDDTYFVDNLGDLITDTGGTEDVVFSTATHALATGIEDLFLLGNAAINGTGNSQSNAITGNSAANTLIGLGGQDELDGGGGADTMFGGEGGDSYVVDNAGDVTTETVVGGFDLDTVLSSVTRTLGPNLERLWLTGTAHINATGNELDNHLLGNSGNNMLDGKAGADSMAGGLGNDTYFVDNVSDMVSEAGGDGLDLVIVQFNFGTYTLTADLENLTLGLTAPINGTGNSLANLITGNSGANRLDGQGGNDTLIGGLGNDTFGVDSALDVVNDTGGIDSVEASGVDWTLAATLENLTFLDGENRIGVGNLLANVIIGNGGNDSLVGLAGNDTLSGFTGFDTLDGGAGNDRYVVDHVDDVVVETLAGAAGGVDTVLSDVSFDLSVAGRENVEHVTLVLGANVDAIGNALNNSLAGNSGHNILDGGLGVDIMAGGNGNDTYFVNVAGDVVTELNGIVGGIDTLNTPFTTILNVNLENLNLLGTGNLNGTGHGAANIINGTSGNNQLLGLAGNDTLSGGEGNDTLDGGAGVDSLTGGAGDDRFFFDAAGDTAVEAAAEGTDTLITLVDNTVLGANLENLALAQVGAVGPLVGTGNAAANVITGNGLNNTLSGDAGHDTLSGGLGNDTLLGGLGNDTFVYDALDGSVVGGDDVDSLAVTGALLTINLGPVPDARYESIERIDLTGTGNNKLILGVADVAELLDATSGTLTIDGNINDAVESSGWELQGGTLIGETFYIIYTDPTGDFTLQVNQDVSQFISFIN